MDLPYTGVYRHVTGTRLHRKDEAGLPVLRKQRTNYATIVRLLAPPFGDKVPQQALPEVYTSSLFRSIYLLSHLSICTCTYKNKDLK